MFFKPPKSLKDLTPAELNDREALLEKKLDNTGRIVRALKIGNAVIIMAGVAAVCPFIGFTIVHVLAGMGIGVVAMASLRASAETASHSLEARREKELQRVIDERDARAARAASAHEQQRLAALEQQRLAEEAAQKAVAAQERQKSLAQSIERDFNDGAARPIAVGNALVLKKRALPGCTTT